MDWVNDILFEHSALQAVVVLGLICAVGLGLGKIKAFGISLGVTFVFFSGIIAGHIGLGIDDQMLHYVENFGLVLFVYTLGLQVGPGFFSSFLKGGVRLNLLGLGVVLLGTLFALVLVPLTGVALSDMMGILCGAVTNTPALAAAQQTLQQMGLSARGAALGCAVTYPLGVIGVILAILLVNKLFVRATDRRCHDLDDHDHTYIAAYQILNPGIFGKTIQEVSGLAGSNYVISRYWHGGETIIPDSRQVLSEGDRVLVVTTERQAAMLALLFGRQEETDWNKEDIDWDSLDKNIVSERIVVSRSGINGKKLGSLNLRRTCGINVTRVTRSGMRLLATPGLRLQYGDRLTVVGAQENMEKAEHLLGNRLENLNEPNLAAIFIGMIIGLAIGTIPFALPGMSAPVKLGLAGGPIVVGILVGAFGPRFKMVTYTTMSANLMLRKLGLSLYLASLGLDAGSQFFETICRPEGIGWVGIGFLITFVPVVIMALVSMRWAKVDFSSTCGMLCGSMANPMALTYTRDICDGDQTSVCYTTVYPLAMFVRVILAQIVIMLLV